jgi:multidrug efflux pump subunit AcrB
MASRANDQKERERAPDGSAPPSLGPAGRLAAIFIDSPLTPLLIIATLCAGLVALIFTPRQEDPEIAVPMVDIFFEFPGASAAHVAELASEPLELIMSEIEGVKHVYSTSRRGRGLVTVRFKVGRDIDTAVLRVHDKIQSHWRHKPPGVGKPLVVPKGIDDVPIVGLTLWSHEVDDAALRTLALDLLERIQTIPETGPGFVVGGRPRQIRIEVLPERLSGYGLTLQGLAQAVRSANKARQVGMAEADRDHYRAYAGAFLRTADDVRRVVIGVRAGRPIYLQDVARVFDAPQETRDLVTYFSGPERDGPAANGVWAVTLAVAKKEGTNGVAVSQKVLARVEALKGELIPDGVHLDVTRDYGKTANDKVNELLLALMQATVAVSILCWIGLGFRPAVVVIAVIPLVVLITVGSAWMLDYSINRVSLFALIFAIGILVDDATVVVENMFRRWLGDGETTAATGIDAVREVGNPTIIATLTIVAALLPMGFVSGMMGPYMRPIPVLGSAAMLFSLLAAFIFTPWLALRLRPPIKGLERAERRERRTNERIGRIYRPVMGLFIAHPVARWTLLVVVLIAFVAAISLFPLKQVAVKMLPYDNNEEFSVIVNLPEGTALTTTANTVYDLVGALRETPEVVSLQAYVGTPAPFDFNGMVRHYYLREEPWQGQIVVRLVDKTERERGSHAIALAARRALSPIAEAAGARITVVEKPPGPPVLQTLVAEIYHPAGEIRRELARDFTRLFEAVPKVVDVDNRMATPHTVWQFEIDAEKARRRGVTEAQVNEALDMAMGGYRLGDVKHLRMAEPQYIVLQLPLSERSDRGRLADLPIPAGQGRVVPLAELGQFRVVPADPLIHHKDLRPVEYVTGDVVGRLGAPIYGMLDIEQRLEGYTGPTGEALSGTLTGPPPADGTAGFEWAGEWTVTYETFRDLGIAFLVALVLIFILIVAEFRNFVHPLVIMIPIPLTFIGIVPGHWLLDAEFTATSMIGFIALSGIIVRNSILLVDFAKNALQEGLDVREAVVRAGQIRLRPIVITDLTLMAGAAAILFDPIFQGMAISLLFGTVMATLLALVAVPLACLTTARAFCPRTEADRATLREPVGVDCSKFRRGRSGVG